MTKWMKIQLEDDSWIKIPMGDWDSEYAGVLDQLIIEGIE